MSDGTFIFITLVSTTSLIILLAAFYTILIKKKSNKETEMLEFVLQTLTKVSDGQQQLSGGLKNISETQSATHADMVKHVESRLTAVQNLVSENLLGSATKTAHTLGELQERLMTIDKAQSNIEKLSSSVLSLQDILSNKQARGAFGEIQLNDIVLKALPPDAYSFQQTLSNGKRVDCLIHLPQPPGPMSIDSKFPLEAYEALRAATSTIERLAGQRGFKSAVRRHIKTIAEKYIIDGETADGALMFIPSEAVYAELHSNFPDVVREGFDARVWVVSPTTCMATLNTMRSVLKDARMREQAGKIRVELGALQKDVERLETRAGNLTKHFELAAKDVEDIKISAKKASQRAIKLDRFEFEESKLEQTVEIDEP
jgi:DNA recombination protein RmuC